MNYTESQKILDEIKKANKILVNCHRSPDADSFGSATALRGVLEAMGKEVSIICPSHIPQEMYFIPGVKDVTTIDFLKFDFSLYDLFITLDSSSWNMISGSRDIEKPKIKFVVIDHHTTNEKFGLINLIDTKVTSTAEFLYKIFQDWDISYGKEVATSLLAGIIGDTGSFQYPGIGNGTLRIAADLMDKGADKDMIVKGIYRNIDFKEIKLWGKIIGKMRIEKDLGFVWSAIPFGVYEEYGRMVYGKEDAANMFSSIVSDTRFGIIMIETKEKYLAISLRSREKFDVSVIAEELGGGGHKAAAGASVVGLPFDEAVEKVLEAARKYAKKD